MSAIGKRLNRLNAKLLHMRTGPGAATLPPNITKLHLEFPTKTNDARYAPRVFWREYLPPLKYHNPTIPMILNRVRDINHPPVMRIYMKSSSSSDGSGSTDSQGPLGLDAPKAVEGGGPAIQKPKKALAVVTDPWLHIASSADGRAPAPDPGPDEEVVEIRLAGLPKPQMIWAQVLDKTGAAPVEASREDQELLERLQAIWTRTAADKKHQLAELAKRKQEKKMLEKARQEVEAMKEK